MLLAIMTIELLIVHPLIAFWSVPVALVLSVLSFGTIGWLLWCVLSFDRLPVMLDANELVMRAGALKGCRVPLARIARVTDEIDGTTVTAKGTLNLALLAWPNIVVELHRPIKTDRGSVHRIAHRLADAPTFLAALNEQLEAIRA